MKYSQIRTRKHERARRSHPIVRESPREFLGLSYLGKEDFGSTYANYFREK
jgi:hypothetical protein